MPEEADQVRTLSPRHRAARFRRFSGSPYQGFVEESSSSPDTDSIWLISLSDLLILLLVFFFFFLTARTTASHKNVEEQGRVSAVPVDQAKPQAINEKPKDEQMLSDKLRDEAATVVRELEGADGITIQAAHGEIVITLRERITFSPGEAEVLSSSEPALDTISRIIQRNPSLAVEIDGHTDNIPISTRLYPSNWELSVARATAVLRYFINRCGIDPSRFIVKGNADLRPIAPNDTPEQRSENRRVEIRLKESATLP
jgi:chemotaxis protein MotB